MSGGKRPAGWMVDLSLAGMTLIWGATFVLVKEAVAEVSTLLFLTVRFAIASAAVLLLFRRQLLAPGLGRSLRGGVLAGCFLFGGYILQTFGLEHTTASKAGFITGLTVPLVPLLSAIVYRKVPQISEVAGSVVAFTGLALMTVERDILDISRGDLLVAGCTLAYAFHILTVGRYAPSTNAAVLIVTQIATGALIGAATFWWAEPVRAHWTGTVWVALAVTALLATALGFSIQTWAQRYSSATRTALIFSLEPLFAWLTSYLVAGEVLSRRGMAGAALILTGILLVELKPLRFEPHPSAK
jgi:drug/metabolite transporter (DMT)-like permease